MASPPPPQPHDTALTLALALPPPPAPYALIPPKLRRPRPDVVRVRSSPTGDTPPCSECGKRFPSWKALFGHMRCHPERQWRGIMPPPRFRHGSGGQLTVQERDVAASLMMLSGADKGKKSLAACPAKVDSRGNSASAALGSVCGDVDSGFAGGQALGGHQHSQWDSACADAVVIATAGGRGSAASQAAAAAVLDLNLPLPGPALMLMSDQGSSSLDEMLELKLGY